MSENNFKCSVDCDYLRGPDWNGFELFFRKWKKQALNKKNNIFLKIFFSFESQYVMFVHEF